MFTKPNMDELRKEFAAWVSTKPADEEYNYHNLCDCAWAQFMKSKGYKGRVSTDHPEFYDLQFDDAFRNHNDDPLIAVQPWTFGALAERLNS